MSQLSSLQCLFCQHLNAPDAVDCSQCEGQLNLQPCHQCGAMDLRTATKCYQCGAGFSPVDAAEFDFSLPPWLVDKTLNPSVATSRVGYPNARLNAASLGRHTVNQVHLRAESANRAGWPRGKWIAIAAILVLSIPTVVAVYVYRGHAVAPARVQGPEQAVIDVTSARQPEASAPSNPASAVDAASKPVGGVQAPLASANRPAKPALTRPRVQAPLVAQPSTAIDAALRTPQNSSAVKTCPPAVATLGLCDPALPPENP